MTRDATTNLNYSFDQENRITGVAGYTYTYDADGNRVEKSNGGTGTIYWYMSPGIVAESDLTGSLKSEYVFFAGERVARKDFPGNTVSYYFSDHLKTASAITNAAGTVTEDEDYYPWGGELQFVNNDSNHYKFTGKEPDAETGLDYFGARYYGNWMGRFMSADWAAKPEAVPYVDLGDPQSLNLYSYVRNVPTSRADPDGLPRVQDIDWRRVGQALADAANSIGHWWISGPPPHPLRGLPAPQGNCVCPGGVQIRTRTTIASRTTTIPSNKTRSKAAMLKANLFLRSQAKQHPALPPKRRA